MSRVENKFVYLSRWVEVENREMERFGVMDGCEGAVDPNVPWRWRPAVVFHRLEDSAIVVRFSGFQSEGVEIRGEMSDLQVVGLDLVEK